MHKLVGLGFVALLAGCGDDTAGGGGSGAAGGSGGEASGAGGPGGGGDGGGGGSSGQAFELSFSAKVNGADFDCGATFTGVGTANSEVALTDFRLYVHDVRLLTSGGDEVPLTLEQDGLFQHEDLALLDFEDDTGSCANGTTELNTRIRGSAPAGSYDGVAFKLGVPADMNHLDVNGAPSPLNLSGLYWAWTDGYKFARIDAMVTGGGPFLLHLGSTGCVGDPEQGGDVTCSNGNVAEVRLTGFDPATTVISVDYGAAVADADLSQDAGGAPGCMSGATDPECAAVFPNLGLDIDTGATLDAQALFSVE